MAGTIPLSMTQQLNLYGEPLAGGQLYLMVAGTVSTPQNGYQDLALTIPLPNPVTLDAAGRIPQFFLADGYIKVRLQDKHGVVQLASDNVLVVGPSSGSGGGGATIDATTIFQTGDIKPRYGTGNAHVGWVRCNGLTIGSASASPSPTERGNADCNALFLHLWNNDATLVVSGGRGASASTDWTSNKTIALPDWRGYLLGAVDDMGGGYSGTLPAAFFPNAGKLGGAGGVATSALVKANLVAHTHSGLSGEPNFQHNHNITVPTSTGTSAIVTAGASAFFWTGTSASTTNGDNNGADGHLHKHPVTVDTSDPAMTGTGFSNLPPTRLCTFYIKL
jgi:hypothetical protein